MNLHGLNLNLLPSLKALLDTQSVSLAAKKMHVTQSAMSRTLAQLRETFNDPLLVRHGNKIFLSNKALSLQGDIDHILSQACTLFDNQRFNPAHTAKAFAIASHYIVLEQLFPPLLQQLWQEAPNFDIELVQFTPQLDQLLEQGAVDLVLGYPNKPPSGFRYEPLGQDRLCAVVYRNHPLAQTDSLQLTAVDLESYPVVHHASFTGETGSIPQYIKSVSRDVRVIARVPSFTSAERLINKAQHILITTEKALQMSQNMDELVVKRLPDPCPEIKYYMVWPEYWEHNRAHRWLREFVLKHLQSMIQEF